MNLGRGKVYNVRCMIDVPGLEADKSLFLGNMEGGSALSGELKVFAHAVNENATSENERYGKTEGYLTLLYEDENGGTEKYIISVQARMGCERVSKIWLKDGKVSTEEISYKEEVGIDEDYYSNPYPLDYADVTDKSLLK